MEKNKRLLKMLQEPDPKCEEIQEYLIWSISKFRNTLSGLSLIFS